MQAPVMATRTGVGYARRSVAGPGSVRVVIALALCAGVSVDDTGARTPSAEDVRVRPVHVLIADDASAATVRGETITLEPAAGPVVRLADEVALQAVDGELRVDSQGLRFASARVGSEGAGPLTVKVQRQGRWSPEAVYPGRLRFFHEGDGLLAIVNEVDLEPYVACVVASEAWPTFAAEALRAQAIASRSYVVYQMTRRRDAGVAGFDLSATQGSQAYRGLRDDALGKKAADAAEYTRGLVLTFEEKGEERLFCTYYNAACGGMSQSAAPLGAESDVPPLRGGVACDFCRIAPADTYRWGPVRIPIGEVQSRVWARFPELASVGELRAISAAARSPQGRIVTIRLAGATGNAEDVSAERFRLAVGGSLMKSCDCRVRVTGNEVLFDQGKGFGHGLGMCQWGAQGQALQGRQAAEILRFYYPDSRLTRVY